MSANYNYGNFDVMMFIGDEVVWSYL